MKSLVLLFLFCIFCFFSLQAQTFTLAITGNSGCGCANYCNPAACSPSAIGNCPIETVNSVPVSVPANSHVRVQMSSLGSFQCLITGGYLETGDRLSINGVPVVTANGNTNVNFDKCYSTGATPSVITVSLTANRRDERVSVTLTTTSGAGTGCTPLPPALKITLSSFTAQRIANNSVMLSWTTESEMNNQYMAVERSVDGSYFTEIGRVNGAGTSAIPHNYQLPDNHAVQTDAYYRLKTVDVNGVITYNKILVVKGNSSKQQISIYPNPVDDMMEITSATVLSEISISDIQGRILIMRKVKNSNTQQINMQAYPAGIYMVKVKTNDIIFLQKVIKK